MKVNLIVCVKIKLRRNAKMPPAISPSATRLDMNGKDVVLDGQAVIGNGRVFDAQQSGETDQQIASTKTGLKLTIQSTSTFVGLLIFLPGNALGYVSVSCICVSCRNEFFIFLHEIL